MFNKKKKYFTQMSADMQKVIWDLEFKKFKTLQVRESMRRQFDQASEALNRITAQSEAQPDNQDVAKQKEDVTKAIENIKAEIDRIDQTISGLPSEDNPDAGVTQRLDSMVELKGYLEAFIKHYC